MRRVRATARPDWRERVESQGLVFPTTPMPDGTELPYWFEDAYYVLDPAEVDELEATTETLHGMCVEAARHLAAGEFGDLGLPPGTLEVARESLASDPPSLYGRFDLRYDGTGPATLLEYNADTPTGLLESSIAQWYWLQDTHPALDQWNSLHERLVAAWEAMRWRLPQAPVWFAHHEAEETGEELMTVTYLRDTCEQAGLTARSITVGDIGWDAGRGCFVSLDDEPMRTVFKLYPWENMFAEAFGAHVGPALRGPRSTTWLEPPWKVLLSNKALLAALWALYPSHPNLVPAYLDSPRDLDAWVAKPLFGREGDGIRVHAPGVSIGAEEAGGDGERYCYQQWAPLPDFDGNKAVLGTWIVDGHAAGVGIRESDGWITDTYARFVPHVIGTPAPSAEQRRAWIEEDTARSDIQDVLPPASRDPGAMPVIGGDVLSGDPREPAGLPVIGGGAHDDHPQDRPRRDPSL